MTTPEATPTPVKAPAAKKVPAKKAPAKKAAATQAAARKATTPKAPAKKAPAPKAAAKPSLAAKPSKAPKAVKPAKSLKAPKAPKAAKPVKIKIVRDSFTMPEADFALIDQIKQRALGWKQPAKKSEVLRAALQALQALPDAKLRQLLGGLAPIKKGRPKNPS